MGEATIRSGSEETAPDAPAVVAALITLKLERQRDRASAERLLEMLQDGVLPATASELIECLRPAHPDAQQWLSWLEGSTPPTSVFAPADPERGEAKSTSGRHEAARRRRDQARTKVDEAKARLTQAEASLREADDRLASADADLSAAVAFALLKEVNKYAAGAFSMGPAWTLMRVASGHVAHDEQFENGLSEENHKLLARDDNGRLMNARELLDCLDRYACIPKFEARLFSTMLKAARRFRDEVADEVADPSATRSSAARRVRRTRAEWKESVHPDCPTADRANVLADLVDKVTRTGEDQAV